MNLKQISVIILTRNESANIVNCIRSAQPAGQVLIFDSGSVDDTCRIAADLGADVIHHPFVNFSDQRNAAMRHATKPWVLFLDADERISKELWTEISALENNVPTVYAIPRHNYFFGKRIRFGGNGNDYQKRLFPGTGVIWEQPVHERIKSNLPLKTLQYPIQHYTTRNLEHYREKADSYIPLEVETMRQMRRTVSFIDVLFRPIAKFLWLYFFKAGILDGRVGFQYAWLSAGYDYKKYRLFLTQRKNGRVG